MDCCRLSAFEIECADGSLTADRGDGMGDGTLFHATPKAGTGCRITKSKTPPRKFPQPRRRFQTTMKTNHLSEKFQGGIDPAKLENVKHLDGGGIRAACPVCRAAGSDKSGEHLLIQPNGKFGCAVHPKDREHRKKIYKLAGYGDGQRNGSPAKSKSPFDWQKCVAAFTETDAQKLAAWRGLSIEFVRWLHGQGIVGIFDGATAFANYGDGGKVVSCHIRLASGKWKFEPTGHKTTPLAFGDTNAAGFILAFESQWDAFAVMDKFGWHTGAGVPDTAVFVTRGAGNGKLIRGHVNSAALVYTFTQNDTAAQAWLADIASNAGCKVLNVATPTPHKDANDWTKSGATNADLQGAMKTAPEWMPPSAPDVREVKPIKPMLEFFTPSELSAFTPPEGFKLVGDYHIQKAAPFVIGGAPGIGKSRAAVALAIAGAISGEWLGCKVHRQFKTMIVQAENGRVRLKNEFANLDCAALDEFVRVCSPPPLGFAFDRLDFCDLLRREIEKFQPDVFILDPFNRLARDDKAKDYSQAFEDLLSVLPTGDEAPALGIVAHTRKPRTDERANGRALLNLLAGSYVIGSVPRTVFVMQAASDDTTDNRIVWTCCKNNDGELGARSAWERRNGLFVQIETFDWKTFDGDNEKRRTVSLDDLDTLFDSGKRRLARTAAVEQLIEQTGLGKTACYQALKPNGKFGQHFKEHDGLLEFHQ